MKGTLFSDVKVTQPNQYAWNVLQIGENYFFVVGNKALLRMYGKPVHSTVDPGRHEDQVKELFETAHTIDNTVEVMAQCWLRVNGKPPLLNFNSFLGYLIDELSEIVEKGKSVELENVPHTFSYYFAIVEATVDELTGYDDVIYEVVAPIVNNPVIDLHLKKRGGTGYEYVEENFPLLSVCRKE